MQEYRAFILGPDGHVENRVDLRCNDECEAISLADSSSTATMWSFGSWISTSRHSGTRPRANPEPVDYSLWCSLISDSA
jgi:hypothetical protein